MFQQKQGGTPGQTQQTPTKPGVVSPDDAALNQSELALKRSYTFDPNDPLKQMETLQKIEDECTKLSTTMRPINSRDDRNAVLNSMRGGDFQGRLDRVIEVAQPYLDLRNKKDLTPQQKSAVDGFLKLYDPAVASYEAALNAPLERLAKANKDHGDPYGKFQAARERYEKQLSAAAPTDTDHSGPPPGDPAKLAETGKAYFEAAVKLLAFRKVFVTRAQADIKKADEAFFAQFGL